MNTFLAAEDALLEHSRIQREAIRNERWLRILITAGEFEAADELRAEIEIQNSRKEAA